jgi:hypothetical protein
MTPQFVSGLDLAEHLHAAVEPLLRNAFPHLRYSAALLGPGSEVLWFDTPRSTDHDWGPRLQLFLTPADLANHGHDILVLLADRLPAAVDGYPTHMPMAPSGTRHMGAPTGSIDHAVTTTEAWMPAVLGVPPADLTTAVDWLTIPTQALAEVTAGRVFHDGLRELTDLRHRLAWYPDQVWRFVLASQWQRLAEEEPFPGRATEAGDDLGATVVTARLARDVMRLCLLMHRRYPPYSKWLGTAFQQLPGSATISNSLRTAIHAPDWPTREHALNAAYTAAATVHNGLGLTPPLATEPRSFHDRPYQVLGADRYAVALQATITEPDLLGRPLLGAADQHLDNTLLLTQPAITRAATAAAYQAGRTQP